MTVKQPIAVVGMAGLFPGAPDLETFWQNIVNKVDTTSEVPSDRWIVDPNAIVDSTPLPDRAFSSRACLIENFSLDPAGIDIDRNLLKDLDPLYHMVLHTGREALAGCSMSAVDMERVGTVLAAIALPTDASSRISRAILGTSFEKKLFGRRFIDNGPPLSASELLAGKVTGLPAAILAKGLGLKGGSYTLDAACASSLYAVKLAFDELVHYRADVMLAGGVSRPECLYTQIGFSQLRALSPTGRCAPFDRSANGLVVGEGAGILVLKRLDDALRHKDTIYATIQGIGLSNDISGNLLSPDTEGQVRAMRKAYVAAGWSPSDVDLIECHGAGTPVGDAIELNSLATLWENTEWSPRQCALGSVKSMTGHLLTAAGAAGMIKTLLAINHGTLPPSLKYERPPVGSILEKGPFRVQTEAEKWQHRDDQTPLRAAVSAFGFGGINAHLLFEEWRPDIAYKSHSKTVEPLQEKEAPVAIIGMETAVGPLTTLQEFQTKILRGETILGKRPPARWRGSDAVADRYLNDRATRGGFMDRVSLRVGEFHIPPNEIPDILPQHLLMLKVAAGAMRNAGLALRDRRPGMSALIGIDFDYQATDFHLRWNLINAVREWREKYSLEIDDDQAATWLESLQDACGPPLTASRTQGALGGLIASRIAREFKLGGPSFVVSADETSGLRALAIAVRALQQNEVDTVLVGAVDLSGDVRQMAIRNSIAAYSSQNTLNPFDKSAQGPLPGEGASALILKRYDRAISDGDRIYAVIRGIGSAAEGGIGSPLSPAAYNRSLRDALQSADVSPDTISYMETHGSGYPSEDRLEAEALNAFFPGRNTSNSNACAVGSVKATVGHTGAAAGLLSVVKTALCLYQEILPPLNGYTEPSNHSWQPDIFHIPIEAQFWFRDRLEGPRRAGVAAMTSDGNYMHVILEGVEPAAGEKISAKRVSRDRQEKKSPLGLNSCGLFVIDGDTHADLCKRLDDLVAFCRMIPASQRQIETAAHRWFDTHRPDPEKKYAVSIVADDFSRLIEMAGEAVLAINTGARLKMGANGGICYTPDPQTSNKLAFVFPGSGNHYLGMGKSIGARWPEVCRAMDAETPALKSQMLPHRYMPWRLSWQPGWQTEAVRSIVSDPLCPIFGQVAYGCMTTRLAAMFDIRPQAVIGYSLGESAGLFATKAWPDRDEMLKRMRATDLFTAQLAGFCRSARKAWHIPAGTDFEWTVAAVNRPAETVAASVDRWPHVKLLIVNTPAECVIGGSKEQVNRVVSDLKCEAVILEGVVTVHCDAVEPVAADYRNLHLFPVNNPENIRFYSCALANSYDLSSNRAADSILRQALKGFDFTQTIRQAYQDGFRVFLEMGPHSSCSRMITAILQDRPHLALSISSRSEDEFLTVLKTLGSLIAERIPVDLDVLYGRHGFHGFRSEKDLTGSDIAIPIGHQAPAPEPPQKKTKAFEPPDFPERSTLSPAPASTPDLPGTETIEAMRKNIDAASEAHQMYLDFSSELQNTFAETVELQIRLLDHMIAAARKGQPIAFDDRPDTEFSASPPASTPPKPPVYSRDMCMEFAVGSVAKVLGPLFAEVDTYQTRVRLPDEPLMLVDRITAIEGEKASLGAGRIVTEHDVLPDAWYLDGGKAPVCISVEAGQADLFLSSYLGIDLAVKGRRAYRLLDATVQFHRGLPEPGDVIRYEIHIDRFVRQDETYLFFFNFEGYIGDSHLITMTEGCAGFFTPREVENSGGIVLSEADKQARPGKTGESVPVLNRLIPHSVEHYDEKALNSLREGNLAACFGSDFAKATLSKSLYLPGGRMKLIDRITALDPAGGRFGLGLIRAEADINPDDWFLTCHFMDDMVMPGTLMYECCAHTLRVFVQRMGWVSDVPGTCYEPVVGIRSVLKCRGPVTPQTRVVTYEIEIKETGFDPEPYAIADAHMYADGHYIVLFKNMSLKLSGMNRETLSSYWENVSNVERTEHRVTAQPPAILSQPLYDRKKILAFATGNPSEAFGEPYRCFDRDRIIARLPAPPYSFIDRITSIEPPPWILEPGGWIESEYDIPADEWYFRAERTNRMPFAVLLEIALQPCGWLAAYSGSALKSASDLKFRNLGGSAVLSGNIANRSGRLTVRCRLTKVSEAADMIIEHFDFQVLQTNRTIYEGNTYFGFFTQEALAQQVGIRDADKNVYAPTEQELESGRAFRFADDAPLSPEDSRLESFPALVMPARALRMIDAVEIYIPNGGPAGLGYIRGIKQVDPAEWFFKAHFYQDPVCPGSLGIESFIQLMKYAALERWKDLEQSHTFAMLPGQSHQWMYRGQIIPQNRQIEVEAAITEMKAFPHPTLIADGFLKVDGTYIYRMDNFGISLLPVDDG